MLIAEFARATALSRDTIRFYIKKGLLIPEIGLSGTNRYQSFDAEQVDRALLIREAQSLGFTLREIGTLSEEYARGGMTLERQAQLMRERLAAVDEQAAKLRRLRRYFAAKVEWLEAGAHGEPPAFCAPAGSRRRSNDVCGVSGSSGTDAATGTTITQVSIPRLASRKPAVSRRY